MISKRGETKNKRIKNILETIKTRKNSDGKDYYIEELRNDTGIPRATLERYLRELEEDGIVKLYKDGPLVRVKLIKALNDN